VSAKKTLYLIDGHAQLFRAFHAIRTAMTSPVTKEPTNATFGFVGMLLKVLREEKPDYLAVVVDASGDRGTFRSEIYPEYKANREAPPETFAPQVERCLSLLEELGVPVLAVERVEADDTIATLAERFRTEHPDVELRIVSKDKDLQQLLEQGRVELRDVHTGDVIDEAALKQKWDLTPAQVVDMLALAGDTVDNVPGVPGIGPKTAAKYIAEHGSLEALLEKAGELKGKRGEAIRAAAAVDLPLSKELVTLRRDVPVAFDLDASAVTEIKLERLKPILKQLGFNRYQQEVDELLEASGKSAAGRSSRGGGDAGLFDSFGEPAAAEEGDYRVVRTKEELERLVDELKDAECVAVDTETTGLRPLESELCGVSLSSKAGAGAYVPVRAPEGEDHLTAGEVLDGLRSLLTDGSVRKCGHNLKFDILALRKAGVELRGIDFDSMIASYVVDASRSSHGLDALALALLHRECVPITDLIGTGKKQKSFAEVPLEAAGPYAAEDADVSLQLREALEPEIESMGLESLYQDVELPLIEVLAELEWNGITVDAEELDRQAERLNARLGELRGEIEAAAPRAFNPDSPKQLAAILFNAPDDAECGLGLRPLKRGKTGPSTDIEVLEKLSQDPAIETPVPGLIVEYRQLTKLVGTYLESLKEAINPATGRIHASFNQTVAATGRLSSSDPNLQNIPIRTELGREIRKAFVAPEGSLLITADYSQIELRLLAHLSKDEALIRAFQEGQDIHRAVASEIHGVAPDDVTGEQRSGAKMVNFGIVYGITPFGLARRLGCSEKEAAKIIDAYRERFPGITTFLAECVSFAEDKGYVETILGRRRPIPQIHGRGARRNLGERMAINSVVQGSAADLIKLAMLDLHGAIRAGELGSAKMLLQIHDELVFEAPEGEVAELQAEIVRRMEGAMELSAPLVVEAASAPDWFGGK
jgi:DNA polymerase-1